MLYEPYTLTYTNLIAPETFAVIIYNYYLRFDYLRGTEETFWLREETMNPDVAEKNRVNEKFQ